MQENVAPPDDEQRQEPEWELASYGRRVGAWAIDAVWFTLPLILLVVGIVVLVLGALFSTVEISAETQTMDPKSGQISSEERIVESVAKFGDRVLSDEIAGRITILLGVGAVAVFIAWASYIVWWLFALRRGQTPGKQIVGIRVIKDDGSPSGWGYTFLREFVIKGILLGIISELTLGAAWLVDYLWPLWDRAKKMQTLHDKLLGTLVIRAR